MSLYLVHVLKFLLEFEINKCRPLQQESRLDDHPTSSTSPLQTQPTKLTCNVFFVEELEAAVTEVEAIFRVRSVLYYIIGENPSCVIIGEPPLVSSDRHACTLLIHILCTGSWRKLWQPGGSGSSDCCCGRTGYSA